MWFSRKASRGRIYRLLGLGFRVQGFAGILTKRGRHDRAEDMEVSGRWRLRAMELYSAEAGQEEMHWLDLYPKGSTYLHSILTVPKCV